MIKSITVKQKIRGRPATGVDPLIGVRIPAALLKRLDASAKAKKTSRSDVIRQLLEKALNQ